MIKEQEEAINKILVYLNNFIEEQGAFIDNVPFLIDQKDSFMQELLKKLNFDFDTLKKILKICLSRGFLRPGISGGVFLTEEGQGRALSVVNAKDSETAPASISIAQFTNHGNAQIGNNNIQNIENTFTCLIDQINKADVPAEQKAEAKNMLQKLIEHPLFNTILGTAASIIASQLK